MNLKDRAKKYTLFRKVNAFYKSIYLAINIKLLSFNYKFKILISDFKYSEDNVIKNFKRRCNFNAQKFSSKPLGSIRIFWVGTNLDQDKSGFLDALKRIGHVLIFTNIAGRYGLWNGDKNKPNPTFYEIRRANDEMLIKQVRLAHNSKGIDLLIGQMWASRVSKEALSLIRNMGIPIINLSMDDRLPYHWSKYKDIRLGSIGLGQSLDLVLTTCQNTCAWYGVEGVPALFFPLASDPELFAKFKTKKRDIDVIFIGNRYGIRASLINYLEKQGIKVICYGVGWPNGYADVNQSAALSARARIILGIGTVGECADIFTLKLRDFDAISSGAMYITHRNPDLTKIFLEGKDIEYYSSPKEAALKISYYLNSEPQRERVAWSGLQKVKSEHTWDLRLQGTFRKLGILQ
jgi:spore maturation protein CgeB